MKCCLQWKRWTKWGGIPTNNTQFAAWGGPAECGFWFINQWQQTWGGNTSTNTAEMQHEETPDIPITYPLRPVRAVKDRNYLQLNNPQAQPTHRMLEVPRNTGWIRHPKRNGYMGISRLTWRLWAYWEQIDISKEKECSGEYHPVQGQTCSPRILAETWSRFSDIGTFAPVMWFDALHTVLAISAVKDWDLQQIDIKGAYLNGELKEELYMRQPTRFNDRSGWDCRLWKPIYGLRQLTSRECLGWWI